jgi:hypothetical protein
MTGTGVHPPYIPAQTILCTHLTNRVTHDQAGLRCLVVFHGFYNMLFWRRQLGHEEVVDHLCLFFGQPFLKELEVFLKRGGDHLGSSHESKLANEDILHNRNCRGPVDGFLGQPGVAPRSRDGRRLCVTPVRWRPKRRCFKGLGDQLGE